MRDPGSAAVELTLLAPLFMVLLLFVVACARLTTARLALQDAAQHTARTLTVSALTVSAAGDAAATGERARAAAVAVVQGDGLPCRRVEVAVDLPRSRPGSRAVATVRLSCTVALQDLTGLALPASKVVTASASSPLDRYYGSQR